jgi:hypothetical protein
MKNQLAYIILIILFPVYQVVAQHTFEQIISNPEDQKINQIIEDSDGNFVLVGQMYNIDTFFPGGYIIKIDSAGNLLNEIVIQPIDTSSYIFFNIHFYNSNYYLLGTSTDSVIFAQKKLWYLKLNKNLDVLSQKESMLPTGKWFSYFNSIIDSDTNFIIAGYTTRSDSVQVYHNDPAFYKMSLEGDSISSYFLSESTKMRYAYDLLEDTSNTQYFAFVSRFENTSAGQKLILTKEFDSIGLEPVPLGITDYYSPTYLNDSSILMCGHGTPGQSELYSLNVISVNLQNQLIDYDHFKIGGNMRDHPAMYNGVSKNGDNIYIGGTSNFDYYNPAYSTLDSWFHLIKINPDITPIWEYWYGGDAYYFLYSILATSDGGCIMVGNRFDYETQDQERDIYIAKVNSNGLIVWTQEIPIEKQIATVYPNPGTNQLTIKTDNKELYFELVNISGQVVIRQIVNNNFKTINTESLKSGIYFYRLTDNKSKTTETGKWIKK